MKRADIGIRGWSEYELLDSGNGRKLERFGSVLLDRPDPQAIWEKAHPDMWVDADAHFIWAEKGERWKLSEGVAEFWTISWNAMNLGLSFKGFKHIGIFPEHVKQWEKISGLSGIDSSRVLNLFGYTGAASIVAALAKAKVTHVDASKQTMETFKENMELSGMRDGARSITEDALRYAKRLVERGEQFEVIIMDPPAFGRGPKGEVWKIEEKLPELLALVPALLSPDAKLVILNGYASGFSARTFAELLAGAMKDRDGSIEYGDISIQEKDSPRILTTGIYSSWECSK